MPHLFLLNTFGFVVSKMIKFELFSEKEGIGYWREIQLGLPTTGHEFHFSFFSPMLTAA